MARYQTKIISRETVAKQTTAFHIEKPAGFTFTVGQHIDVAILNPVKTDYKGTIRPFSIASPPSEKDIVVATRITESAFKEHISTASLPIPIEIEGPMGSFVLHKDPAKPAIFLAGGIGVTQFRSIIKDVLERTMPHQLHLLHSNRTPADAPFMENFMTWKEQAPNFVFVPTVSLLDEYERFKSGWNGHVGRIDWPLIQNSCDISTQAIFYAAGPPAFVKAMVTMLSANGILEENIRTEEFSGY